MTSQISTKLTAAQLLLGSIATRAPAIAAVVAAGLGLADLPGVPPAPAEAGLPPPTPTRPDPE